MRISFESKGNFDNVTAWLNRVSNKNPSSALNSIANEGSRSLSANTPKDTGETASGWNAKVTANANGGEIAWTNNAHPDLSVNLAKLIDLGHGTGTGGYVPPKPYIKNAMTPVWANVDKVVKELIE